MTGVQTCALPICITAKMVFESAVEGDEVSKKVVERFVYYLSIGIANLSISFLQKL